MALEEVKRRLVRFIIEYGVLIAVLVIGLIVWVNVFDAALVDYLDSANWNSRAVWLGGMGSGTSPGQFYIFDFTITYQFEGYSDYSFFYVHWGHNMLNGVMPYCDEFGVLEMDGITNENGLYIFPPLTAVFYAIGILIPVDNWGIGLLIVTLGFLTALPVYGIAKELSNNRRVGEVAALTYLLAPNVLYHTTFLWTNPAPFYFFFFSGFYMLIRNKRHTGTLLIVTAALFKQTAWFLGIPLVIYLIVRSRLPDSIEDDPEHRKSMLDRIRGGASQYLDLRAFMISVIVVLLYVGAVMLPFMVAQPNFWNYMRLAAGGFPLESFTDLPPYSSPMRLQVLPVAAGLPTLAEFIDLAVYSGGLLVLGVILFAGLMVFEPKYEGKHKIYLRRILFFTMLIMLWVNLAGPRGVYKYYFTLMAPFFSIFSSAKMATSMEEDIDFSVSMLWAPILFSLMILIPVRTIYLAYVLLIFLIYLLVKPIGDLWFYLSAPGRWIRTRVSPKLAFMTRRRSFTSRLLTYAYPEKEKEPQEHEVTQEE